MRTAILVFCAALAACGPSKGPAPSGDPEVCAQTSADVVAVTFNAGLAPGIERHAQQRIAPVAEHVAALGADILCLQEVWNEDAILAVTQALGLPAGNVFRADTRGEEETGTDVCAPGELDDAMACARANCSGVPDVDALRCATDACQAEAIGVYAHAPRCFNCLVASAGKSLDDLQATCDGGPGASRLYGGENGVLLASKRPLTDVEVLRLPSSGANRVAIFATIDGFGAAPIDVVCTHLSSSNLIPPTDPRFATWTEEQLEQVRLIEAKIDERASGHPALLMGDLNSGPEVDGHLEATDVEAWDALTGYGFGDPAADADPPVCSRCEGNLLSPTDNHLLIDHVMTLDAGGPDWKPLCAHAVMNEPVTVIDGASVETSMSDHFGTLVKLDLH